MTVIINKDQTLSQIDEKIKRMSKQKEGKVLNAKQFFGKINFGEDGLNYQKKVRDEWTQNSC